MSLEDVLRPVVVIGGAVLLTLVLVWLTDRALRRIDAAHPETPLWGLLRRCRIPLQVVLCAALLRGSFEQAGLKSADEHAAGIGQALTPGPDRGRRLAGRPGRGGDRRVVVLALRGERPGRGAGAAGDAPR